MKINRIKMSSPKKPIDTRKDNNASCKTQNTKTTINNNQCNLRKVSKNDFKNLKKIPEMTNKEIDKIRINPVHI